MDSPVFIEVPIGSDGRDRISINVADIASYRGHVVTSYSYVDCTLVVLKNGTMHDCWISKTRFEKLLNDALAD